MQATHNTMKRLAVWVCWIAWCSPCRIGAQDGTAPTPAAAAEATAPPPTYGARARVREEAVQPTQPKEAETAALSEDLGTSFSLAESLPGSLPVFSGVPYLIVRGATPSGTATYYDGVLIPSLFHIALGPAVVDPNLLGKVTFHAGVPPARYGRNIGGALVADAPRALRAERPRRVLELTLLDASGYLYVPEIRTAVAWRVGDPGLLMQALGLDATLNYYDYQVRHEATLGAGTELVLLALGAGDELGDRTAPEDDIALDFHRVLARITRRVGDTTIGTQLVLGYDHSLLGEELDGEGLRAAPSVFVEHAFTRARFRAGADYLATHVSLTRRPGRESEESEFDRSNNFTLDPQDFLDGQPFASLPARGTGGVFAELEAEVLPRLTLSAGVRGDVWLTGSHSELAASPSGRVRFILTPGLELFSAIGVGASVRGSPVPLPSLSDVSIDAGLSRALQFEAGASWQALSDLQLQAAYFRHRYDEVVYLELILDCPGNTDPNAAQTVLMGTGSICRGTGLPTADGVAQGLELYVKRDLTARLAGFASYTLSFAEAQARDGTRFTPQSDVRHMINAVLRFDLGAGFALGARLHFRSGKMAVNTLYDEPSAQFTRSEARLPGFFRADVRGSYSWRTSFGRLEASVGVQNVTASSEPTNRDCFLDTSMGLAPPLPIVCNVDYQRAILLPNLGLRAEM